MVRTDGFVELTETDESENEDLEVLEEKEEKHPQHEDSTEVIKKERGMTRMLKLHRDFSKKETEKGILNLTKCSGLLVAIELNSVVT